MTVPTLSFVDRVIFTAGSGGTSAFIPASPVTGYQSMTAAGALVNAQYGYTAQSPDLGQWEVGYGLWNGTTLTRTVLFNYLGNTSPINFTAAPQVLISAMAESIENVVPPVSGDITFYVSVTGNDATAVPGDSTHP